MGLHVPVGFAELFVRFRLDGDAELMVTTLGFRSTSGTSTADLTSAAADCIVAFTNNVVGSGADMFTTWNLDSYVVSGVSSDQGEFNVEVAINLAGTFVGTTPPNNCALLVRKTTGLGGRAHRGRFFVPPATLGENNVNNYGVIASAALTQQQTNFDGWLSDMLAGDCQPVILHTSEMINPTDITNFVVEPKIATQRRRLRP